MRPPRNYFVRAFRRDAGMLSRVADSLYWMSRYLERAEHTARLVDVELQLWLDQSPEAGAGRWRFLLEALRTPVAPGAVDPTRLVDALVFNRKNSSSIVSCIASARENLRHVREQCSSEMWEQLNRLYLEVMEARPEEAWMLKSHGFFRAVLEGAHLFQGITDGTMSHGEGWQYIQLGRYVERTDTLASLMETHFKRMVHPVDQLADQVVESAEYLEWVGLLRACVAFEAYCKVYTADITADQILEFLLLNAQFPHSLRYSVDCLRQALVAVQHSSGRAPVDELTRISGRLQASLSFVEVSDIMAQDAGAYLHNILQQCRQTHDLIYRFYIQYSVEAALAM
jgi:uncharacterized alpha-E superfamily protein